MYDDQQESAHELSDALDDPARGGGGHLAEAEEVRLDHLGSVQRQPEVNIGASGWGGQLGYAGPASHANLVIGATLAVIGAVVWTHDTAPGVVLVIVGALLMAAHVWLDLRGRQRE